MGGQASLALAVVVAVVAGGALLGAGRPAPASAPAFTQRVMGAEDGSAAPSSPDPGSQRSADPLGDRASAMGPLPVPPDSLTGYVWPLVDARITGAFGPRSNGTVLNAGVPFHDGIDIANFCGAHVVAAHDGIVLAAGRRYDRAVGWVGDLGPYETRMTDGNLWGTAAIAVVIDDGNGYRSIYLHFSRIAVKEGDRVTAGQFLGWEGRSGYASGCHLHYGLFSPFASGRFQLDSVIAERTKLPAEEIARVDPLLVLPPLGVARITWGWGAIDTP